MSWYLAAAAATCFALSMVLVLTSRKKEKRDTWEKEVIAKIQVGLSSAYSLLATDGVPAKMRHYLLRGYRPEEMSYDDLALELAVKSREVSISSARDAVSAYNEVNSMLNQMLIEIQEIRSAIKMRSALICLITAAIAPVLEKIGVFLFQHGSSQQAPVLLGLMLIAGASFFGMEHSSIKSLLSFLSASAGVYFFSSLLVTVFIA
ncbi:MAG: hypothetical protein QXV32_07325 [Conexivisphaerales archaeon]